MKRLFAYSVSALALCAALALTSCDDKVESAPVTPNFPEPITAPLYQGASYTFEITPSADCSISIEESQWFWIDDNGQHEYYISGKAGQPLSITIATLPVEENDVERSCQVTMTMLGQSKVIATLVRKTTEREIAFRLCTLDSDGAFTTGESGSDLRYTYNEDTAESVALIWPEGINGFSYPILIEANFKWHLVAGSCPEWLTMSTTAGDAGEKVEVRLSGDNMLEDQTATIYLCDHYNNEAKFPFTVSMPNCRDRFSISGFAAESVFDAAGKYKAGSDNWLPVEVGATGDVTDIEGTVVYKFAFAQMGFDVELSAGAEDTAWITAELASWTEDGGNLQSRELTITVSENTGTAEREGLVYAIPAAVAPADPNSMFVSATEIDSQYDSYLVTRVRQLVPDVTEGSIVPTHAGDLEGYATYSVLAENQRYELANLVPGVTIPEGYFLHYTSDDAADHTTLKADREYTVKYYNAEYTEMVYATDETNTSWLEVRSQSVDGVENAFKVIMTPGLDTCGKLAGMQGDNLGFIVFFDKEGAAFSMLRCEYTEPVREDVVKFVVEFVSPSTVSGAMLRRVNDDFIAEIESDPTAYAWVSDELKSLFKEELEKSSRIDMYVLRYTVENPTDAALKASTHSMVMCYGGVMINGERWIYSSVAEATVDMSEISGGTPHFDYCVMGGNTACTVYCVASY